MDDELAKRREWFEIYWRRLEQATVAPAQAETFYACPACGYPTLSERGSYEICLLCGWEDDGQDDPSADEVWSGPNGDYSLSEARKNFAEHLTMYRPADRAFEQKPAARLLKLELIDVYDRMTTSKDASEIEVLAARAAEIERQL